jgi:multiple sugar transport system ATP-binding protein
MTGIVFEKVNKYFDDNHIIKDFSAQINDREFIVLVGPSGCGKSTILRLISGLEEISSGNIFINGKIINDVEPKNRNISMVFQNYALYPHMNVYDNISFGLKIRKYSKSDIKKRTIETAKLLQLEELLSRKPKELSGGQRQRVALGRAIAREPEIFLFDEPLSNLDAKLRTAMRKEIMRIHKVVDKTSIYVTHDQIEAMTMADRMIVMNKGEILQFDTPDNIYNNPADIFTAEFIGSPQMNISECFFEIENEKAVFKFENISIKTECNDTVRTKLEKHINKKIYFGIRPENVIINSEKSEDFSVSMKVENIENMGSEKFVYLKNGNLKLTAKNNKHYNIDENLNVEINSNKILFFDYNTGKII